MGLLNWLFCKRIDVYIHIDGSLKLDHLSKDVSNCTMTPPDVLKRHVPITVVPEIDNVQIPVVDFGHDVEDKP